MMLLDNSMSEDAPGMAVSVDLGREGAEFNPCLCCLLDHACVSFGHMSLVMRKSVFGVSDQVRPKLACSAKETSFGFSKYRYSSI